MIAVLVRGGRRTEPVPIAIVICAEIRKAKMDKSGRMRPAEAATLKQKATVPIKVADMTSVPQKCSSSVARSSTPNEAHSHSTPSITP